jgi:D-amino peptidase
MFIFRRLGSAVWVLRLILIVMVAACVFAGLITPATAQSEPVDLTRADITKLKTLDSSQWTVLGVRLGDSKETALKTLQGTKDIKVQDDPAAGRIFVIAPPSGNTVVMSVKITQGLVTAINLVGGFGEWLQGDTRLLFRAFEDDSLRYKLLGREDHHEVVKGGTNEAPAVDMSYSYFKEGILLHYGIKRSADGKQIDFLREMVLIFPAKPR